MGLVPITDPERESTGDWKFLTKNNNTCPGCGKEIHRYDENVEHSRTKRGTHIFWHSKCTGMCGTDGKGTELDKRGRTVSCRTLGEHQ